MRKGIVLIGAGVLATAAMIGLAGVAVDWKVSAVLVAAALAGLVWLYRFDSRREEAEKERAAANDDARFHELSALAASPQFELQVAGSSQIYLGVAFVLGAGIALPAAAASESIAWALGGAAALAFGVVLLLGSVPTLGKPKISITRLGFKTPLTPFVPWKLVEGIDLEAQYHRGRLMFHRLQFLIPSLPLEISRFALFHRLIHRMRTKAGKQRLLVTLASCSEHPNVLYRLIRQVWTVSTGRTHFWNPNMSEAYNVALKEYEEAENRLYRAAVAGLPTPADAQHIDKLLAQSRAVISAEEGRRYRMLQWAAVAFIAVVVLYVAAVVVGHS